MVKNEADIIESSVRHTLVFADAMLVMDHKSTDDTRKILERLKDEGLPLVTGTIEDEGHIQAETMTALMYRAINEYDADLIVALDADEFLLHDSGDGKTLRDMLRELPTDTVYYVEWINYALSNPEKDGDKFTLSRPCKRNVTPNNLCKVIVGRQAAVENDLYLVQGNHFAPSRYEKGEGFDFTAIRTDLADCHLAHFPWRSKEQRKSKSLCGWLSNIAKYSRYSYYTRGWRDDFNRFVAGGKLSNYILKDETAPPICRGTKTNVGCATQKTKSMRWRMR